MLACLTYLLPPSECSDLSILWVTIMEFQMCLKCGLTDPLFVGINHWFQFVSSYFWWRRGGEGTGVQTVRGRLSTTWATFTALFCSSYFFRWGSSYLCLLYNWGGWQVCTPFLLRWSFPNFVFGLALNENCVLLPFD
jgi:hypothetical protein